MPAQYEFIDEFLPFACESDNQHTSERLQNNNCTNKNDGMNVYPHENSFYNPIREVLEFFLFKIKY